MKHWTRLLIEMDAEAACEHAWTEGYNDGHEVGLLKGYETGYRQAMRHIDEADLSASHPSATKEQLEAIADFFDRDEADHEPL